MYLLNAEDDFHWVMPLSVAGGRRDRRSCQPKLPRRSLPTSSDEAHQTSSRNEDHQIRAYDRYEITSMVNCYGLLPLRMIVSTNDGLQNLVFGGEPGCFGMLRCFPPAGLFQCQRAHASR